MARLDRSFSLAIELRGVRTETVEREKYRPSSQTLHQPLTASRGINPRHFIHIEASRSTYVYGYMREAPRFFSFYLSVRV